VFLDPNKLWDMLRNVLRNSQAALDFRWLQSLRDSDSSTFVPRIVISMGFEQGLALLTVTDNGGGVSEETATRMFQKPVLSRKRKGKTHGQGTLFVKFFADRMNIRARARNTSELGSPGLQVVFELPLDPDRAQGLANGRAAGSGEPPE
jgi:sensor histidine kinase regulating citrate/malate metabolism